MKELRLYLSLLCVVLASVVPAWGAVEWKPVTSESQLTETDEYTFVCPSLGFVMSNGLSSASTYAEGSKVTVLASGSIVDMPSNAIVVKFVKINDAWQILVTNPATPNNVTGNYLTASSATTTKLCLGAGNCEGVSISSDAAVVSFPGNTQILTRPNNGRFSNFTKTDSNTAKIQIYRKYETTQVSPNLKYSAASAIVKVGAVSGLPTLSKASGVTGIEYSTSDSNVATVTSNGTVSVKGAGVATITASVGESDKFFPGSAQYTLVVCGSDEEFDNLTYAATRVNGYYPPKSYTSGNAVTYLLSGAANTANGGMIFNSTSSDYAGISVSANNGLAVSYITIIPSSGCGPTATMTLYASKTPFTATGKDIAATATKIGQFVGSNPATVEVPGEYRYFAMVPTGLYEAANIYVVWREALKLPELSWGVEEFTGYLGVENTFPVLQKASESVEPILYSSSVHAVATIDENTGVITLLGEGTTVISANFASNNGYDEGAASYTLNVVKSAAGLSWKLNDAAWTESEYHAIYSKTETFPTLVNPNGLNVTYKSSNEAAATVSSTGVVTLLDVAETAETTISATFNGNANFNAQTLSYVLVVAPQGAVTGLKILPNSGEATTTIKAGDEVSVACDTEGVTYTLKVFDGNGTTGAEVADLAQSGTIIAPFKLYKGVYTVQVTAEDPNGNLKPSTKTVVYTVALNEPALDFGATEFTAYFGETNNFPKLTTAEMPEIPVVTYTSSNEKVATVDASGNITLQGVVGTTTITASVAAGNIFSAQTVSYTLNVLNPALIDNITAKGAGYDDAITFEGKNGQEYAMAAAYNTTLNENVFAGSRPLSGLILSKNTGYLLSSITVKLNPNTNPGAAMSLYVSNTPYTATGSKTGELIGTQTGNNEYVFNIPADDEWKYFSLVPANTQQVRVTDLQIVWRDGKPLPELAWSAETAQAVVGGKNNTFPTLTNSNEVEVSYKSSDVDVATVDANGNVTLVAAGSTEISATYTGAKGSKFDDQTVSYTLTVTAPELAWTLGTEAWTGTEFDAQIDNNIAPEIPQFVVTPAEVNVDVTLEPAVNGVSVEEGKVVIDAEAITEAVSTTVTAVVVAEGAAAPASISYLLKVSPEGEIAEVRISPESGDITIDTPISVTCATPGVNYNIVITNTETNAEYKTINGATVEPFTIDEVGSFKVAVTVSKGNQDPKSVEANYTVSLKDPELAFNKESVTVSFMRPFATPQLTAAEGYLTGATVVYSSDNTAVASVDATTGALTVYGQGDAVITATVTPADDSMYAAASASYTLNIEPFSDRYDGVINFTKSATGTAAYTADQMTAEAFLADSESKDLVTSATGSIYQNAGGVRLGATNATAASTLTLNLDKAYKLTQVVVTAAKYGTNQTRLNVNGVQGGLISSNDMDQFTYTFSGKNTYSSLELSCVQYGVVISSVELTYIDDSQGAPVFTVYDGDTEITDGDEISMGTVLTLEKPNGWKVSYYLQYYDDAKKETVRSDATAVGDDNTIVATSAGQYVVVASDPEGRYAIEHTFTVIGGETSSTGLNFASNRYGMSTLEEGKWQVKADGSNSFTLQGTGELDVFIPKGQQVAYRKGGKLQIANGSCIRIAGTLRKLLTNLTITGEGLSNLTVRDLPKFTENTVPSTDDIFTSIIGKVTSSDTQITWTGDGYYGVQLVCGQRPSQARAMRVAGEGASAYVTGLSATLQTPTGVETVTIYGEGSEMYDLCGNRVSGENLRPGIYIVRNGDQVYKIMVK